MEKLNFEQFKSDVHRTLISKLDLEKLGTVQASKAKQAVASLVQNIITESKLPLSASEKEKIQSDLLDEVFGLGPLEALLRDPKVSDILVNSKDVVYVERGGILQKTDIAFRDDRHRSLVLRPQQHGHTTGVALRPRLLPRDRASPVAAGAVDRHRAVQHRRRQHGAERKHAQEGAQQECRERRRPASTAVSPEPHRNLLPSPRSTTGPRTGYAWFGTPWVAGM